MSWAQEMNAFRMISVVIGSTTPVSGLVTVWDTSALLSRPGDQHVAVLVEPGPVPRRDDGGGALLLDHERPVVALGRAHPLAQEHGRVVLDLGEDDGAPPEHRGGTGIRPLVRSHRRAAPPHRGASEGDELDRGSGPLVPVTDAVR